MGLLGIFLGFGLLLWLAYRGWSVMLVGSSRRWCALPFLANRCLHNEAGI